MKPLTEVTKTLLEPLDDGYKKKRGKGGKNFEYMMHTSLALMMNNTFGPLGWDLELLDYQTVGDPYVKKDAGTDYWNVEVIARVKLIVRATVGNNQVIETVRTAAGAGEAFGGKARTRQAAIHVAITAAQAAAFKRAALYFGPKTGLMLKFEGWERKVMQEYLDASAREDADVETEDFTNVKQGPSAKAADKPKAEKKPDPKKPDPKPAAKKPEPKPAKTGVSPKSGAQILADHIDNEVLQGIGKLKSDDVLSGDQIKAIHGGLVGALDKASAVKVWEAAGIKPGPKAQITKTSLAAVIQSLEEMAASASGNGIGSQAATLPAGEDLRKFLAKKIGDVGKRKDLIDLLVKIGDEDIMPNADAGALHALGMNRLKELDQPASDIQTMWDETGFKWGSGIPNGKQARNFVHNLPDQP